MFTVDRVRQDVLHFSPVLSTILAVISLGATTFLTAHPPAAQPTAPFAPDALRLFDVRTGAGLGGVVPTVLDAAAGTNRTLWTAVATRELHAGVQRVEVGAGVPVHAHDTEEVLVVLGGRAEFGDGAGATLAARQGAVVHVARGARHVVRNAGDAPLLLMWLFPARDGGAARWEFRDAYAGDGGA